jgi:hypothetical protein
VPTAHSISTTTTTTPCSTASSTASIISNNHGQIPGVAHSQFTTLKSQEWIIPPNLFPLSPLRPHFRFLTSVFNGPLPPASDHRSVLEKPVDGQTTSRRLDGIFPSTNSSYTQTHYSCHHGSPTGSFFSELSISISFILGSGYRPTFLAAV